MSDNNYLFDYQYECYLKGLKSNIPTVRQNLAESLEETKSYIDSNDFTVEQLKTIKESILLAIKQASEPFHDMLLIQEDTDFRGLLDFLNIECTKRVNEMIDEKIKAVN